MPDHLYNKPKIRDDIPFETTIWRRLIFIYEVFHITQLVQKKHIYYWKNVLEKHFIINAMII